MFLRLSVVATLLLATSAFAEEVGKWTEIVNCNGGAMVIDKALTGVSGSHRSYAYQAVIRDRGVINFFVKEGTVYSRPNYPEILIPNLSPSSAVKGFFASDPYLTHQFSWEERGSGMTVKISGNGKRAEWKFESCRGVR